MLLLRKHTPFPTAEKTNCIPRSMNTIWELGAQFGRHHKYARNAAYHFVAHRAYQSQIKVLDAKRAHPFIYICFFYSIFSKFANIFFWMQKFRYNTQKPCGIATWDRNTSLEKLSANNLRYFCQNLTFCQILIKFWWFFIKIQRKLLKINKIEDFD